MSHQIKKLLRIEDTVYSAQGGVEMTVTSIDEDGFFTEEDYYKFNEVRKLYYLTRIGYERRNKNEIRKQT